MNAALNDTLRRAMASINMPAMFEASGILRTDGISPDGMTLVLGARVTLWFGMPRVSAQLLSPLGASKKAGPVAELGERSKSLKYSVLDSRFLRFSVSISVPTIHSHHSELKHLAGEVPMPFCFSKRKKFKTEIKISKAW